MYLSPLRYPGGKGKLSNYIKQVMKVNNLYGGTYVEVYAGGCAVALEMLFSKCASKIIINDISKPIYSFWYTVLNESERLCNKILETPVTVKEWHKQREVQQDLDSHSIFDIGFSTFYLNRTNRSGILTAGVIGGLSQEGDWKIDARFNKDTLIRRIERIAEYKDNIELHNLDAEEFIKEKADNLTEKTLIYLDPPYYNKGKHLYENYYSPEDHTRLAAKIKKIRHKWILTYDNTPEIEKLYKDCMTKVFTLNYSAANKYKGSEIMVYSNSLIIPEMDSTCSLP